MADEKMGEEGMESGKNKMYCKMCGYGRGHFAFRLLLGLILLLIVFWLGVMAGHIGGGHRRFGSYGRGGYMQMQRYPNPMMRGYPGGYLPGGMMQGAPGSAQAQPATSTPIKK